MCVLVFTSIRSFQPSTYWCSMIRRKFVHRRNKKSSRCSCYLFCSHLLSRFSTTVYEVVCVLCLWWCGVGCGDAAVALLRGAFDCRSLRRTYLSVPFVIFVFVFFCVVCYTPVCVLSEPLAPSLAPFAAWTVTRRLSKHLSISYFSSNSGVHGEPSPWHYTTCTHFRDPDRGILKPSKTKIKLLILV